MRIIEELTGIDLNEVCDKNSTWTFILAIFESGWDKLHTSGKTSV